MDTPGPAAGESGLPLVEGAKPPSGKSPIKPLLCLALLAAIGSLALLLYPRPITTCIHSRGLRVSPGLTLPSTSMAGLAIPSLALEPSVTLNISTVNENFWGLVATFEVTAFFAGASTPLVHGSVPSISLSPRGETSFNLTVASSGDPLAYSEVAVGYFVDQCGVMPTSWASNSWKMDLRIVVSAFGQEAPEVWVRDVEVGCFGGQIKDWQLAPPEEGGEEAEEGADNGGDEAGGGGTGCGGQSPSSGSLLLPKYCVKVLCGPQDLQCQAERPVCPPPAPASPPAEGGFGLSGLGR